MSNPHALVDTSIRRVDRAFAFIDLCGFTDFADARGDEAAVAELAMLRSIVRTVAPHFGVRVDKWLGDGVLVVGVESEPLVEAVGAVMSSFHSLGQLLLRAGMAGGSVVLMEGDDYVGRPVNLAARLCDAARPGTVLADPTGLRFPPSVTLHPAGSLTVKGFAAPIEAAEVRRDDG